MGKFHTHPNPDMKLKIGGVTLSLKTTRTRSSDVSSKKVEPGSDRSRVHQLLTVLLLSEALQLTDVSDDRIPGGHMTVM